MLLLTGGAVYRTFFHCFIMSPRVCWQRLLGGEISTFRPYIYYQIKRQARFVYMFSLARIDRLYYNATYLKICSWEFCIISTIEDACYYQLVVWKSVLYNVPLLPNEATVFFEAAYANYLICHMVQLVRVRYLCAQSFRKYYKIYLL